jgi:hypothetical protein
MIMYGTVAPEHHLIAALSFAAILQYITVPVIVVTVLIPDASIGEDQNVGADRTGSNATLPTPSIQVVKLSSPNRVTRLQMPVHRLPPSRADQPGLALPGITTLLGQADWDAGLSHY